MTDCAVLRARGGWAEDAAGTGCRFPIAWRNTYSNLSYALAGLWLVLTKPGSVTWVMGAALLILAIGSALYHGTKQGWANNLDWLGMYLCMTVLMIHGIAPKAPGIVLGASMVAGVLALMFAFDRVRFDWHMGVLFLLASIPAVVRGEVWLTLLSVGLFGLGFLCWQLDKARSPLVGLWGHSWWHCSTAAAMAVLFVAQR